MSGFTEAQLDEAFDRLADHDTLVEALNRATGLAEADAEAHILDAYRDEVIELELMFAKRDVQVLADRFDLSEVERTVLAENYLELLTEKDPATH